MRTATAIKRLKGLSAACKNKRDKEALDFAIAELSDWLATADPEQLKYDKR
jgi:hypothetical protein